MEYLHDSLANNSSLEILNLSFNDLGSHGLQFLCHSLHKNKFLRHIILHFNNFGKNDHKKIISLLKINCSLENLSLVNVPFDLQSINFLLQCNRPWCSPQSFHFSPPFNSILFTFVSCLKLVQKCFFFSIPKFILYEIIKWVDRKSFYPFFKSQIKSAKKRKRIDREEN